MINLPELIARIEHLLAEGTPSSATYAALECRLAIEKIAYDRLRISHEYISHDDLARWRPQDVISTLLAEVDDHIGGTTTMSIAMRPHGSEDNGAEQEPNEKDWIEFGTQYGLDHRRLGDLWQSLSRVALHVAIPKSKDDPIEDYGDYDSIKKQVNACIDELRKLARSTMQISGVGMEISFKCLCGRTIKRRERLLAQDKIVGCVGPDCPESYKTILKDGTFVFERRAVRWKCECGEERVEPARLFERMRRGQYATVVCDCGAKRVVQWSLQWVDSPQSNASGSSPP